jgi:O-antigen/teichoic acid export membrane protein
VPSTSRKLDGPVKTSSSENVVTLTPASNQNDDVLQGPLETPGTSDFKRKSMRGGAATALGQGVSLTLQIGTTLVLARLLSPTDYGLQAMVVTLTAFLGLFKDAGLNFSTVQREILTQEQISTLFWINVGIGAFLTILVAAAGPVLVAFYREPRLLWITIASASVFFITSLGIQHRALLDRGLRFTTNAKIDTTCGVVGTVVAIGMALLGCGYWSLIVQTISIAIAGTVGVWIAMPWLPGRPRRHSELGSMLRVGGTVTLNSLVVYVAYNTEKVLLGRFWGPAALGIYGRAFQLANLPVDQATNAFGSVAFPMLSRLQNDPQRLIRSYLKTHSLAVSLTVPMVFTCALFANEIVRIMLGQKWANAATVLRLLSPAILVFALINPLSWLLRATGLVKRSLNMAFLIAPVVILGVIAGLRHGPAGVALGYSAAMVLLFGPLVAWGLHGTGATLADYWDCIKRPLIAGATAGIAGWFVHFLCVGALSAIPLLAIELISFAAVYAGMLLFVMQQKELYFDLVKQMLQRPEASQAGA